MNSVTSVLVKTQEMPDTPFNSTLEYYGIEIKLKVLGVFKDGHLCSCENYDIWNEDTKFNPVNKSNRESVRSVIEDRVHIDKPVDDVKNVATRKENNEDVFIAYRYDDGYTYIVEPVFHFAYKINPNESSTMFYCIEVNEYEELPESTPKSKINGEIRNESGDIYIEASNILQKLFGLNKFELELELKDDIAYYDRYELMNTNVENDVDLSDYSPAYVDVTDEKFVIETEYEDENIEFEIPLTEFGTLPNWVDNRLDINMLLTVHDSNETLLAQIKPSSSNGRWVSKNGEYELVNIE